MFKIESYITPIILSHIDKYVKNIRPQDSQVSLWGGEVAFQNLDLRLDVLEEELQLPFNLLSGHIHELSILVPWTKIASEPITITINTIEFVLKLRDGTEENLVKKRDKKKVSKAEEMQAPPGYMASLVNKIANNISVKCNNIILKYVEEDIVVSMNIQHLSFDSADADWNPAFVDISPTKVVMRKIINLTDLTICLDKRNSAGKIEICQEPILYRSTIDIRVLRRYNSATVHRSSMTRVDVVTDLLNLNISTQQFPMVMRLLFLGLNLKQGNLREQLEGSSGSATDHSMDTTTSASEQSYLSWAWNLIPSIFPDDDEDDYDERDGDENEIRGHILHTGIYVDRLEMVLKSQEMFGDPIMYATKKIKYIPFMKMVLEGMYTDSIGVALRWFSTTGGISKINIFPVGDCTCGARQDPTSSLSFFESLEPNANRHKEGTLFEPTNGGNVENSGDQRRIYETNWDSYLAKINSDYLMKRTPAIAFDILHQIEENDDVGRISSFGSNLEYSNLSERTLYRAIIGPFKLIYNTALNHVLKTLNDYVKLYNYAPYVSEKPSPSLLQLTPPSTDDFDALMTEIPLIIYDLTIFKPCIEFETCDHKKPQTLKKISTTIKPRLSTSSIVMPPKLPTSRIILEVDRISCKYIIPQYPNRLVYTTCQLPDPPHNLFDACYTKIEGFADKVSFILSFGIEKIVSVPFIEMPRIYFDQKTIIRPDLWPKKEICQQTGNIAMRDARLQTNRQDMLVFIHILNSILNSDPSYVEQIKSIVTKNDAMSLITTSTSNQHRLELVLKTIHMKKMTNMDAVAYRLDIDSISGFTVKESDTQQQLLILSSPENVPSDNDKINFLSAIVQIPTNEENAENPSIIVVKLAESCLSIDSILCSIIDVVTIDDGDRNDKQEEDHRVDVIPVKLPQHSDKEKSVKKLPKMGSVHSSSEVETLTPLPKIDEKAECMKSSEDERSDSMRMFERFRKMVISLEVGQCTVLIPKSSIKPSEFNLNFNEIRRNHPKLNMILLRLPYASLSSSQSRPASSLLNQQLPIELPSNVWSRDREGFPWTMSLWDLSISTIQTDVEFIFLKPTKTTITLAITQKEESFTADPSTDTPTDDTKSNIPLSLFFHIDTSPIVFDLHKTELSFLVDTYKNLSSITLFATNTSTTPTTSTERTTSSKLEISQRIVSPNSQIDLKDLFGVANTGCTSTKESVTVENVTLPHNDDGHDEKKSPSKISILLQWTLTKLSVQMFGNDYRHPNDGECKLIMEFEDIISSISRQNIFVKIKNKIGSASCEFYQRQIGDSLNNGGWLKNEALGFNMRAEQTMSTDKSTAEFFELTVTTAETENVHSKWTGGTTKRDKNLIEFLTEIMIGVQQVDMRIDLDLLRIFAPIFEVFLRQDENCMMNSDKNLPQEKSNERVLCVADLPLIYFFCKGIRIFLPIPDGSAHDTCNVCIMKVSQIALSPNVDNPMTRLPVRPDIYTKAAQLRMLNARGSKIEDRQYELQLTGISVATASWKELSAYMDSLVAGNLHENPAFEWNNKQNVKSTLEISTIFKEFNFSVVFAPSIIFKNILVCGSGLELNCLTDLAIDINSHQLELAHKIFGKWRVLNESLRSTTNQRKLTTKKTSSVSVNVGRRLEKLPSRPTFEDIVEFNETSRRVKSTPLNKSISIENVQTDSGFESHNNTKTKSVLSVGKKPMKKNQLVPFDVWFVGGVFTINIFHIPSKNSNSLKPLASLSIHQPNSIISQTIFEKTIQLSIFDVRLCLADNNVTNDGSPKFEDVLFETRRGELDVHGIQQPVFRVKYVENVLKDNEVEVHFSRPMKIRFCEKTVSKLIEIREIMAKLTGSKIDKNVSKAPELIDEIQPMRLKFRMRNLRSYFCGVSRASLFVAQTVFHLNGSPNYDAKLAFSKFQTKIELHDRPDKINFNILLKCLTLNQNAIVVLHPLTVDVYGNFVQESWNRIPSMFVAIKSNYIQVDISPDVILNLTKVREGLELCLAEWNTDVVQQFDGLTSSPRGSPSQGNVSNDLVCLTPITLGKPSNSKTSIVDEYYQDDLRAGAFQFIEAQTEHDLPLPYQILIQNQRERGIICWRYPQPRALNHVQVYPVPFQTTAELKIKCQVEYYSDPHNTFLPYSSFSLSENETQILNLPRRKVTSSIWRIIMSQSMVSVNSSYFQDENESQENDSVKSIDEILTKPSSHRDTDYMDESERETIFHLHPKVLVACMKIDSFFSPPLVPKIQCLLNISQIQLNLLNSFESPSTSSSQPPPDILKHFVLLNDYNAVQKFVAFNVHNLKLHANVYDELEATLSYEFNFSSDILDYSYLTMQSFVDDFHIESFIEIGDDSLRLNVLASELKIKYGPSIGHTLGVSEQLWRQQLVTLHDGVPNPNRIILTRFTVCNDTNMEILFGQSSTEERIYLTPKQCALYPFRSPKFEQKLSFTILDSSVKETSDPVQIGNEGIQYVQMEATQFIIIKTEKMSPSQKRVVVKGQTEFINMSTHSFTVSYNVLNTSSVFKLGSHQNISVFGNCHDKLSQAIKIQLNGEGRKGWSGLIPLQKSGKNNAPWLVKVPTNTKHNFISFWVRVMRENIANTKDTGIRIPQRILVVIWPLFMIKSMLSIDTTAFEEGEDDIRVPGRGQIEELKLSGTVENDHELIFKMNFTSPYGEDKRRALLSYKLIDRNDVFTIPEKFNSIEKVIEELLQKPKENKWPCSREEELRLNRETTFHEVTMPVYNCSLSQELSCSLMLNISPWCLFINSTGVKVKLLSSDRIHTCLIDSNHIGMPFVITKCFTISIEDGLSTAMWRESPTIFLNSNPTKSDIDGVGSNYQVLADEEHITVFIYTTAGISQLNLTSINENGVRIIILSSCFVIGNFTAHKLTAFAYAVRVKEKQKLTVPNDFSNVGCSDIVPNQLKTQNPLGTPIVQFLNLSPSDDVVPTTAFNYFVSFSSSDELNYSYPIHLNKPFNRKSITVTCAGKNIPLTVSQIEYNNQMYISIYDDSSPAFSIENHTELKFYVAQSSTVNVNATATAVKECFDDPFDWYQLIHPNSQIFYTPVCHDNIFPDIKNFEFGLIFAVANSYSLIKWSSPVQVNETKDVILKLPQHDGIKLTVDCRSKTTRLTIGYISENQEFCVRDLRSRLSNPTGNDGAGPSSEIIDFIETSETRTRKSDTNVMSGEKTINDSRDSRSLKVNVYVKEFSVIFFGEHDTRQCEKFDLISFNFDDVAIIFNQRTRNLNIGCSNLQIDNLRYQSKQYDFPVVLCSQSINTQHNNLVSAFSLDDDIEQCFNMNQLFSVYLRFYEAEIKLERVNLTLNPIRAYLEDTYLNYVFDFLLESLPTNLIYGESVKVDRFRLGEEIRPSVVIPKFVEKQSLYLAESFKLRSIKINPLDILLSVHTSLRMYIALDHSPLHFSTFERHSINTLPMKFGYVIGKHYLERAAIGAGWVVGSLEILGSPSGLARSVTTGIKDFVSLPMQGLLRGPWGFLVGLTQGSASLIRNVTAGTVNSVSKLAASVSRNLDWLTLDEQHLMITDSIRRSRPQGITEGISHGLTGLGISLLGAVGGLARHPLEARSAVQVMTGVGKGIVGAFAKPISGAAELVALTGQGVLQSVGYNPLPVPRGSLHSPATPYNVTAFCKIPWKLMKPVSSLKNILFSSMVTLKTTAGLKSMLMCLSNEVIAFLSLETDELVDVLTLHKISEAIDDNDPTLVILKPIVTPTNDSGGPLSAGLDDPSRLPISPRTYQFVWDSIEHRTSTSSYHGLGVPSYDLPAELMPSNESGKRVEIFIDQHLAEYFIRYVALIKRTTSNDKMLFSLLDEQDK